MKIHRTLVVVNCTDTQTLHREGMNRLLFKKCRYSPEDNNDWNAEIRKYVPTVKSKHLYTVSMFYVETFLLFAS